MAGRQPGLDAPILSAGRRSATSRWSGPFPAEGDEARDQQSRDRAVRNPRTSRSAAEPPP
jgi:hypothetical protein